MTDMADFVWPDVHGRVNVNNGLSRYYRHYLNAAGTSPETAQYPGYKAKLDVMCASRRMVLVTTDFFPQGAPGKSVSAGEVQSAKDTLVDQVNALWNQRRLRMRVVAYDAAGQEVVAQRVLDVQFRVRYVLAGGDYALVVYPTTNDLPLRQGGTDRPAHVKSGSSRIEMHIAATEVSWVYSHEYGHCIGIPDEYGHAAVQYIRPDGTNSTLLQRPGATIPTNMQGNVVNGVRQPDLRTEMSTHSNSNLMPRHLWPTAREVRRLLNRHARGNRFGVEVEYGR